MEMGYTPTGTLRRSELSWTFLICFISSQSPNIAYHCPQSLKSSMFKKCKRESNVSLVNLFSLAICLVEMTLNC